eukprot:COSAG01_NODE_1728_length_9373_cov_25.243476_10_plen_188_part_00
MFANGIKIGANAKAHRFHTPTRSLQRSPNTLATGEVACCPSLLAPQLDSASCEAPTHQWQRIICYEAQLLGWVGLAVHGRVLATVVRMADDTSTPDCSRSFTAACRSIAPSLSCCCCRRPCRRRCCWLLPPGASVPAPPATAQDGDGGRRDRWCSACNDRRTRREHSSSQALSTKREAVTAGQLRSS